MNGTANEAERPLLLLLAPLDLPARDLLSASLATLARRGAFDFEVYYGARRLGVHWGGGDPDRATRGAALGPNPAGGETHRELLYLLARRRVVAIEAGEHPFEHLIDVLKVPVLARTADPWPILEAVCDHFAVDPPAETLVIDPDEFRPRDLIAYLYPEVCFRDRLALPAWTPAAHVQSARARGVVRQVEWDGPRHDPLELSRLLVARHGRESQEILIADPAVVAHWLPWCVKHRALALHAQPQVGVIREIEGLRCSEHTVWGRQFDDRDFTELSRRGRALQVIDPASPPFPAALETRGDATAWNGDTAESEPDDPQLLAWAREGRVLASLVFWSGAARELQNLPAILDLVHTTGLQAGIALGTGSVRFGAASPLSMLAVPRDAGGCFPLLEPLLGSSGVGISFESLVGPAVLREQIECALAELRASGALPRVRGWWPTLDGPLVERARAPKAEERPYDRFDVGAPDPALHDAVRDAGLEYALSKYAFGPPALLRRDDDFTVLNYTAGRWAGWSPFIDVPNYAELRAAERRLVARRQPGWLLGSLDTCLWAFPRHLWERGHELYRVAAHLTVGGASRLLINVRPHTIVRYARLLHEHGYLAEARPERPERWSFDVLGLGRWAYHYGKTHYRSWKGKRT